MKTLYVSDLDGTLLNSNKQLSHRTVTLLNEMIDEGVLFTVATARTPATVVPLLEEVNIQLPIVVMNGSFIYDMKQEKYIYASQIPYESVRQIIDVVESVNKQLFIYTIKEDKLTVYYKGFNTEDEKNFYEERKDLKLKKFIQVEAYNIEPEDQVGHMVMIDSYQVIKGIKEQLETVEGIKVHMYPDVNTEDSYLLEISASGMNKAKGVQYVVDQLDVEYTVAFGDNLNDLDMLEAADCGCAVENAEAVVKEVADRILDTNDEDSVARFIKTQVCTRTA